MLTTNIEDGPRGPSSKHSLGLQQRTDMFDLRCLMDFSSDRVARVTLPGENWSNQQGGCRAGALRKGFVLPLVVPDEFRH